MSCSRMKGNPSMDDTERAALAAAVKELNAQLATLIDKYRGKIEIRPGVNFAIDDGIAEVVVRVNTGTAVFR